LEKKKIEERKLAIKNKEKMEKKKQACLLRRISHYC